MTQPDRLTDSARVYVSIVILAGVVAVCHSLYVLRLHPVSYHWTLLAGLTLLSGSFTIRIPTIPARLSVSETFVFAAVLLFGPAAATMIVVLDSLIISLWLKQRSRRPSRVLFNVAAPSVAIWIASHIFYLLADIEPLGHSDRPILPLLVPLLALAILYFLLNSMLVAWAVAFEKGVSALTVWRDNFLWLSLNYFSGASVAALLLPYLQPEETEFARVIGVLLPLLLISYLTFKTAMGRVDDANRHLQELNGLYLSTIETLAMAIDAKDQITHGHIRRVQIHAVTLSRAMGVREDAQIRAIEAAALLHDMGKLAVPEYILNKPGPLTVAEFEKMKLHASVGADILSAIDFPYPVVPIVRHHHENWNGTGYPDKLAGAAIPIGARILSVVDCFDALTSDRPYRPRLSDKEALSILADRRGEMYDPLVVDTFLRLHAEGAFRTESIEEELSFAALIAPSASIESAALNRNRLEDIAASGEEMLALFELARGLNRPMSVSEVGEVVVKHLRRMVPAALSVLYLYDVTTDELVSTYASGDHADIVGGLRIPLGQRLTGWVGANRQTIRNSDPILDLGESVRAVTPRPKSCLSAPLTVGDSLVGVLTLYSSGRDAFSEDHQRVVEVITRQVAPVVQQALTFGRSRTLGSSEGVTESSSNDVRLAVLARSQSVIWKSPLALVWIELGGWQDFQSQTGQNASSALLEGLVTCTQQHLRAADILFRYESGEILIVLFHTDKVLGSAIADQIRQAIESEVLATGMKGRLQVSVGISAMPEDGQSAEGLRTIARRRARRLIEPAVDGFNQPPESVH
jgi:diguanylate cyclase (GGDEF)-like protein/putative nucleotidyltransferase with HDIG domain